MPPVSFRAHTSPKLRFIQQQYDDLVTLAAEKVTRHLQHPEQYPLPAASGKSLERALYDVLMELPKRKRDDFMDKFKNIPGAGTPQRKERFKFLHTVDLRSNIPVAEQVRTIHLPEDIQFTEQDIRQLESLLPPGAKPVKFKRRAVPRQAIAGKLDFIVDSITCTETSDLRKDEIDLGGFSTDNAGVTQNKAPFFVSKFKKGQTVSLGAKGNLFSFSLDAGSTGGTFPATFVAGIFVNERDLFSNADLARKLSVLFTALGAVLMVAGILMMALIPSIFWVGMAVFLIGSLSYIFGNDLIPLYLIDDLGIPALDTIVFDTAPPPGEVVTRTLQLALVPLEGFVAENYTASIRWVTS